MIAGAIAATFVCPLDVVKTRLQVHRPTTSEVGMKGIFSDHHSWVGLDRWAKVLKFVVFNLDLYREAIHIVQRFFTTCFPFLFSLDLFLFGFRFIFYFLFVSFFSYFPAFKALLIYLEVFFGALSTGSECNENSVPLLVMASAQDLLTSRSGKVHDAVGVSHLFVYRLHTRDHWQT